MQIRAHGVLSWLFSSLGPLLKRLGLMIVTATSLAVLVVSGFVVIEYSTPALGEDWATPAFICGVGGIAIGLACLFSRPWASFSILLCTGLALVLLGASPFLRPFSEGPQAPVCTSGDSSTAIPATFFADEDRQRLPSSIQLALSGGGYRAMLFHLGALWRMNELGLLPKLTLISSVSGGSIAAGALAVHWSDLRFDEESGVSPCFISLVAEPLMELAGQTIDVPAVLSGSLWTRSASDELAAAYSAYLFEHRKLQNLPLSPSFVFNSTNLQTGENWEFRRDEMGDPIAGYVRNPAATIAEVVAASSAYPPVLSPFYLVPGDVNWRPGLSGLS